VNVNQEYERWISQIYGDTTLSKVQYKEMKKSFFAGAFVAMVKVVQATESDSEDICVTRLSILSDEINETIQAWCKTGKEEENV